MFSSSYIASIRRNFYIRVFSPTENPCRFRFTPFSSSSSTSKTENRNSFAVNYLINTLGFSPEKAFSASKYLKFDSPEKPDAVVAFLNNHGFTGDQIGSLIRKFPTIILRNPNNSLLPKIQFFQCLGFSDSQVKNILLLSPCITCRSLDGHIKPTFSYIKSLFDANGTCLSQLKLATEALRCDLESRLLPNIEALKGAGAPSSRIVYLLQHFPRVINQDSGKFRKTVEDVKKLGLDPSRVSFVIALHVLMVMSKSGWEKRVEAYKKWGFSENEITVAFGKFPNFMTRSLDKITGVMDFFVNEMGLDYSFVLRAPGLVSYSLEKRIKPRSLVYKKLLESGLISKGKSSRLASMCKCAEKDFLKRYVLYYDEIAPELVDMYRKELLAISKSN
ncbi:hypothetical protein ABFS82_07G017300 [Erythranthe guttata]|uniref:Uncharacterized protein n=1 Tax=Erythranthe guttata TaxID=4155 RepID=A0A022Q402_ERYGU|nr:PREDICTED: uncharacterized protein LOC105974846 [Erythranthe guttata]EYU22369.1 hypothetical protein MIMGU_mgv1a026427mg [Erythranthe guttata]|eukprot:XP_012855460.1 PREDICTED: uncharacterized protein LOC105974846 [Erythranthe guttata]